METAYAERYDFLEGEHWYFRARRVVLKTLLDSLDWPARPRILEIGCGPGHNLVEIYPPDAQLTGVEPEAANARRAAERSGLPVHCAAVENLPPEVPDAAYDAVCLFDVLEHIEDDRRALQIIHRKLKPGGILALAVPAYMWMWGQQDTVNQHFRRYTLGHLRRLTGETGYRPVRGTYFNTTLFPMVAIVRLLARLRRERSYTDGDFAIAGDPSSPLLYRAFACESSWLRHAGFPFGVSAFLAARKPA